MNIHQPPWVTSSLRLHKLPPLLLHRAAVAPSGVHSLSRPRATASEVSRRESVRTQREPLASTSKQPLDEDKQQRDHVTKDDFLWCREPTLSSPSLGQCEKLFSIQMTKGKGSCVDKRDDDEIDLFTAGETDFRGRRKRPVTVLQSLPFSCTCLLCCYLYKTVTSLQMRGLCWSKITRMRTSNSVYTTTSFFLSGFLLSLVVSDCLQQMYN